MVKYNITPEHARRIVSDFSKAEEYLRSLVYNVTSDKRLANESDYSELIHQGMVILGVAKKILRPDQNQAGLETKADAIRPERETARESQGYNEQSMRYPSPQERAVAQRKLRGER